LNIQNTILTQRELIKIPDYIVPSVVSYFTTRYEAEEGTSLFSFTSTFASSYVAHKRENLYEYFETDMERYFLEKEYKFFKMYRNCSRKLFEKCSNCIFSLHNKDITYVLSGTKIPKDTQCLLYGNCSPICTRFKNQEKFKRPHIYIKKVITLLTKKSIF